MSNNTKNAATMAIIVMLSTGGAMAGHKLNQRLKANTSNYIAEHLASCSEYQKTNELCAHAQRASMRGEIPSGVASGLGGMMGLLGSVAVFDAADQLCAKRRNKKRSDFEMER